MNFNHSAPCCISLSIFSNCLNFQDRLVWGLLWKDEGEKLQRDPSGILTLPSVLYLCHQFVHPLPSLLKSPPTPRSLLQHGVSSWFTALLWNSNISMKGAFSIHPDDPFNTWAPNSLVSSLPFPPFLPLTSATHSHKHLPGLITASNSFPSL